MLAATRPPLATPSAARRRGRAATASATRRGAASASAAAAASERSDDASSSTARHHQHRVAAVFAAAALVAASPALAADEDGIASTRGASAEIAAEIVVAAAPDDAASSNADAPPIGIENVEDDDKNNKTPSSAKRRSKARVVNDALFDYAGVFTPERASALTAELTELESSTGWKVRVVTGYEGAINDLYRTTRADRKTVIMTADEFKGNVLEFYYDTSSLKEVIPKNVFQEMRGRYGNKYYVYEEGLETAVVDATEALRGCLARGGCAFVPGLSPQQREFSLVAVITGGFLFGAATAAGKSAAEPSPWTGVFIAIWVPWVFAFGFYPLYVRQPEDLTPLIQNAALFAAIVLFTSSSPLLGGGGGGDGDGDAARGGDDFGNRGGGG